VSYKDFLRSLFPNALNMVFVGWALTQNGKRNKNVY
jgi:hypothetical protein